jgi:hypothetical protein
MAYMSEPYRNAVTIANALMMRIVSQQVEDRDMALLAREWLMIENAKRQWRGLPPLKAASVKELLDAKKANARTINTDALTIEETPDQTVPAPPAPEAPSPPVVGNDK